jgi:hypothetical protein
MEAVSITGTPFPAGRVQPPWPMTGLALDPRLLPGLLHTPEPGCPRSGWMPGTPARPLTQQLQMRNVAADRHLPFPGRDR